MTYGCLNSTLQVCRRARRPNAIAAGVVCGGANDRAASVPAVLLPSHPSHSTLSYPFHSPPIPLPRVTADPRLALH